MLTNPNYRCIYYVLVAVLSALCVFLLLAHEACIIILLFIKSMWNSKRQKMSLLCNRPGQGFVAVHRAPREEGLSRDGGRENRGGQSWRGNKCCALASGGEGARSSGPPLAGTAASCPSSILFAYPHSSKVLVEEEYGSFVFVVSMFGVK